MPRSTRLAQNLAREHWIAPLSLIAAFLVVAIIIVARY